MANCIPVFMRIDTRMVHGQIVVRWTTINKCRNVIIVDHALANDAFMANFYKKAAQKGIKTDVISPEEAVAQWNEGCFGPEDINTMLVFKDVANAYNLWKSGFPMEEINLGNQVNNHGRRQVSREVFLTLEDYQMLKEMHDAGLRIFLQAIPEDELEEFSVVEAAFAE